MPQAMITVSSATGSSGPSHPVGSGIRTCVACGYCGPDEGFAWRKKGVTRRNRCLPCEARRGREKYARPETKIWHLNHSKLPHVIERRRKRYRERLATDPEFRAKVNAKNRIAYQSPEVRRKALGHILSCKYGMTLEDYDKMLVEQLGACAICKTVPDGELARLCIDHDHETGRIRGLLCDRCNRGIGLLRDDPAVLDAAAQYLRSRL